MKALITSLVIILAHCPLHAKEYHVSITGLDGNLDELKASITR